ncbi:MAG: hypothetical protein JW700_00890 [Candidatus Aenigmarchaeota archaeon]|nr:hypothetical protein [Candidatus Aenigmarchaeota archaeon]
MDEEKKRSSEDGESVWKNLIEEVKEEAPKPQSIEESASTKQEAETQDSIEKKPIENSIEIPKEETQIPSEKPKTEDKPKEDAPKKSKFTTIMLTKELKAKLEKAKDPHESYGDYIQRLIEKT